jgi:hypothetical protein
MTLLVLKTRGLKCNYSLRAPNSFDKYFGTLQAFVSWNTRNSSALTLGSLLMWNFHVLLRILCTHISSPQESCIFHSPRPWFKVRNNISCRSQWPCCLRRGSSTARLLGSWLRIPPRAWMSVSCECCLMSGRGLCDGLVRRPEESYRLWCVWCVWPWNLDETRRPRPI